MLSEIGFSVISLNDAGIALDSREDDLEVFDTFEENALAKARWFYARGGGRPVLADDSGLTVDALNGRPGVRSKRWSERPDLDGQALDDANNALLLATLQATGMPEPWVGQYVCAAACVISLSQESSALEIVARGQCEGAIVRTPRGEGGFGYDPHFMSADFGRTFAEVSRTEKETVSHRGRAFRALIGEMQKLGLVSVRNS